jgi:hypothetical protein
MRGGYSASLGGKVKPMDKKLLEDSPYVVRHAVEYFNKHMADPKKALQVKKHFLEEELRDLKLDQITIEKEIDEINQELGIHEYSKELGSLLDYIQEDYIKTAKQYGREQYANRGSMNPLSVEDYVDSKLDFLVDKAIEIDMDVKQLCKEVIDYVKS